MDRHASKLKRRMRSRCREKWQFVGETAKKMRGIKEEKGEGKEDGTWKKMGGG